MLLKFKFHSIVDVITNSSTVIYTYQDSITEAKELVSEIMKMAGIEGTPDDVFYYGVFCDDDDCILGNLNDEDDKPDGFPKNDGEQEKWLKDIQLKIMKGEIEEPEWMESASSDYNDCSYGTCLRLAPKDEKYDELGLKIKKLLNSTSAEEGGE